MPVPVPSLPPFDTHLIPFLSVSCLDREDDSILLVTSIMPLDQVEEYVQASSFHLIFSSQDRGYQSVQDRQNNGATDE